MSAPHPLFRIDAEHQPGAYVIRIQGALYRQGCPELDLVLKAGEQSRAGRIILDLKDLTFIDSAGLGTLLKASRRSATNGNRLQLTRGKGYPADMFRLTALDKTLPFTDPNLCPAIRGSGLRWEPEAVAGLISSPRAPRPGACEARSG